MITPNTPIHVYVYIEMSYSPTDNKRRKHETRNNERTCRFRKCN